MKAQRVKEDAMAFESMLSPLLRIGASNQGKLIGDLVTPLNKDPLAPEKKIQLAAEVAAFYVGLLASSKRDVVMDRDKLLDGAREAITGAVMEAGAQPDTAKAIGDRLRSLITEQMSKTSSKQVR
jgi:hypothetical protein